MNILEKDFEDLLWEGLNDQPKLLAERGLKHQRHSHYLRQPELGAYGRPDIIGYTVTKKVNGLRFLNVTIYELKKEEIDIDTLLQAGRYATGVERYFKTLDLTGTHLTIQIKLIGKSIDTKSDFVFLADQLSNVSLFTISLDLEHGMRFEHKSGYFKTSESLPKKKMSYNEKQSLIWRTEEKDWEFEREHVEANPF